MNIIFQLQQNQNSLWNIVKEIRHTNQYRSDEYYYCSTTILPINMIRIHNDLLGNHTGVVGDYIPNKSISKEYLQKAAEMFI